jgi:hypothetical protein
MQRPMSTKTRRLVALGAVVILGLGAVTAVWRLRRGDTEEAVSSTTAGVAEIAALAGWPVAQTRNFSVQLKTRVSAGDQSVLALKMNGTWLLARAANKDGAGRIVARFEPAEIELGSASEETAAFRNAIGETVLFEVTSRGLVRRLGFQQPDAADPLQDVARTVLRAMVASVQIVTPAEKDADQWQAREGDITGTYEARYQRGERPAVTKTKLRYVHVAAPAEMEANTVIDRSVSELRFAAPSGSLPTRLSALERLDLDERTHIEAKKPMPELRSDLSLSIALQGTAKAAADRLAGLDGIRLFSLSDRTQLAKGSLNRARLAGPSFVETLDELAKTKRGSSDRVLAGRAAKLYSGLVAHLRFDDAKVAEATKRVRTQDAQASLLINALGDAGSPAAQHALRQLAEDASLASQQRRSAVLAVSLLDDPNQESVTLLTSMKGDETFGRQARFGLGNAAYNLGQSEPGRSDAITQSLLADLQNAQTDAERITILTALGNAGQPETLSAIEPFLANATAPVRAAAVDAIRRIPGSRVDELYARVLRNDASGEVRLAASRVLEYRNPTPSTVYAIRDNLRSEAVARVRKQSVRVAIRWADRAPPLVAALENVASNDPDPQIRDLASRGR